MISVGDKFGRLTVYEKLIKPGKSCWACLCDCGAKKAIRADHLSSGVTQSCGCIAAEKGKTNGTYKTPAYKSWTGMLDRCNNSSSPRYADYGGRGVHVCAAWTCSFLNFLADMGERPDGKTLDRIDNFQNYTPANCKWSTPTEQARNRRGNRIVEFEGEQVTMSEAAERMGLGLTTLKYRLDKEERNAHLRD